jgi:hypothetical protein
MLQSFSYANSTESTECIALPWQSDPPPWSFPGRQAVLAAWTPPQTELPALQRHWDRPRPPFACLRKSVTLGEIKEDKEKNEKRRRSEISQLRELTLFCQVPRMWLSSLLNEVNDCFCHALTLLGRLADGVRYSECFR